MFGFFAAIPFPLSRLVDVPSRWSYAAAFEDCSNAAGMFGKSMKTSQNAEIDCLVSSLCPTYYSVVALECNNFA